jgi:hypothetical protein
LLSGGLTPRLPTNRINPRLRQVAADQSADRSAHSKKKADYEFVTIWRFKAPQEKVCDSVFHSENSPEWWPSVEKVERLKEGGIIVRNKNPKRP